MKKIILILVMLYASLSTCFAADTDRAWCVDISEIVTVFAQARYAGIPLSKATEGLTGVDLDLVYTAYELPNYSSAEAQQEATTELANQYFKICMESIDSPSED